MKTYTTYLASLLLVLGLCITSFTSKADGGKSKAEKVFTRWELSPIADIYYRVEIVQENAAEVAPKTISVEFLNNYKKEVSFCFAVNDNGTAQISYLPVVNLKKKKTTILEYPRPQDKTELKVTITSVEVGK